jgi:hypothetical protein
MEKTKSTKLSGAHHNQASLMVVRGWKSRNFSQLPVEGEIFFLTFPFIDQAIAQVCAFSSPEFEVNQRYRDFAIYRQ